MNRNVISIIAIIILVFVVLFGTRHFFGVDNRAPTVNFIQLAPESASPETPSGVRH